MLAISEIPESDPLYTGSCRPNMETALILKWSYIFVKMACFAQIVMLRVGVKSYENNNLEYSMVMFVISTKFPEAKTTCSSSERSNFQFAHIGFISEFQNLQQKYIQLIPHRFPE